MTNTLILAFLGSGLVFIIYLCSLGLDPRQLVSSPYMATEVIQRHRQQHWCNFGRAADALIHIVAFGQQENRPAGKIIALR